MNGFTENERIYVGDCYDHDRFRWTYYSETGLIENWNRNWIEPHCIAIPKPYQSVKKQQLYLAPCDKNKEGMQWIVENGQLRVRNQTPSVCAMWNLRDKTRMWGIPCGESIFAPMV